MFPEDHPPPHLHVSYAGVEFCVDLRTGEVTDGAAPAKQLKLVRQWMILHEAELQSNWKLAERGLPPMKVKPLE